MDAALVFSVLLMGLMGGPHCVVMCGPACAAAVGGQQRGLTASAVALHGGRLISYSAVGAWAAASVGALAALSASHPWLRPIWTLVHAGALGLGLWMLLTARQPAWMADVGRRKAKVGEAPIHWRKPARNLAIGSLWAAWPCGLLHSALVVAALGNSAASGALVMGAFWLASTVALVVGQGLWQRLRGQSAGAERSQPVAVWQSAWATRLAGLLLAGAALSAMGHGLWTQVYNYCFA